MFASFITPGSLALLRQGPGAPFWRLVTTTENAVVVNFVSLAIILLCIRYLVRRICIRHDGRSWRVRLVPYFAMAAFAVTTPLADQLFRLSPFLLGLVPIFLSAVFAVGFVPKFLLTSEERAHTLNALRLVLSGILSAIGVWESVTGLLLAPLLLLTAWRPSSRREITRVEAVACWMSGFIAAFLLEPYLLSCPWGVLIPRGLPLVGYAGFLLLCVVPILLARRFSGRRWVLVLWGFVLAVVLVNTLRTMTFNRQSASERFVRRMLADLGSRKLILGDGRFDVLIDELKPADVKRIGRTSALEKEFLLRLVEDGQQLTNKVLLVRNYHDLGDPEFVAALAETGLFYRKPNDAERKQRAKTRAELFQRRTNTLLTSLKTVNEGFGDVPEAQRALEQAKAQTNIRQGWKDGFGGTRLSTTILNIDLRNADRATLESDALNALLVDREDPAANSVMGQLRFEEGRLELAERYLRKGVKGGGALAMSRLAMLLVNTNRAKEAEEWARKAVALIPDDWNLRQPLVAALTETGRYDEALRELEKMVKDSVKANAVTDAQVFAEGVKARIRQLQTSP